MKSILLSILCFCCFNIQLVAQSKLIEKELILAQPHQLLIVDSDEDRIDEVYANCLFLEYIKDFNWLNVAESGAIYTACVEDHYGWNVDYFDAIKAARPDNYEIAPIGDFKAMQQDGVVNTTILDCTKYWKKNNESLVYGPSFSLYKAKVDCIYLGEEEIWVPDYEYKKSCKKTDKVHAQKKTFKVYGIVNVKDFKPVSATK